MDDVLHVCSPGSMRAMAMFFFSLRVWQFLRFQPDTKKHDMEIVCIPVVLFLFLPLVDELNSLCLVDHSSSSKRHKVSPPGSKPTTQPDINMHLSKHATPSHERHQRHSHCHMCAGQKVPHKASTHACNDSHSGVFFPPTANSTPSTKPTRPSPHDICTPPATPAAIAQ